MKVSVILSCLLFAVNYAAHSQTKVVSQNLTLGGRSLPAITHVTDMKIDGDTLYFVYETRNGYGQRFLQSALIDKANNRLEIGSGIGKKENGYYESYMPYPFFDIEKGIHVASQDVCEIYDLSTGGRLTKTKKYLISSNSSVPLSLSQYVQDVFMISPESYVFIGREPKGGAQYAITENITTEKVDTIRKIAISPKLSSWMPNSGELACSVKYNRLAFGYSFYPIIEFFGMDGKLMKQVRVSKDTFNPKTLKEADFEDSNPWHFVDITQTENYIYALYWGYRYTDSQKPTVASTIYQINWEGDIVNRYVVNKSLRRIACSNDSLLVGWSGRQFIKISLP